MQTALGIHLRDRGSGCFGVSGATTWVAPARRPALIDEKERARSLSEILLSLASPLDLYAEELDGRSCRHLGTSPQAFTHLA